MKRFSALIVILGLLLSTGCAETGKDIQKDIQKEEDSPEIQLYTAYNIWRLRTYLMRCINYKYGNKFIPAGTKVSDVKISDDANGTPRISFVTADDNQKYGIYFTSNGIPGIQLMITKTTCSRLKPSKN